MPFDLAAYADFVTAVAQRYRGTIAAYVIWNEPNLAAEWSRSGGNLEDHWRRFDGQVADPADYVGVLGVAYQRIKTHDPAVLVVTAGLAPTNENSPRARDDRDFLRAMLAAGAADCFDVLGVHAYGFGQHPEAAEAVQSGLGLARIGEWQTILAQYGVDRPMWVKELGYTIGQGSQPWVTPAQQASYLSAALDRIQHDWPSVELVTVWNLVYGRAPEDEMSGYSLLNPDGSPRPAYERLRQQLSAPPINHPLPTPHKLGIHLLLDDGRHAWPVSIWRSHLVYARQAVGEWGYVIQLVRMDDLDVDRWQQFIDLCAELQLTPILRLATRYDTENNWWLPPPPDADNHYHTLAARYAQFITSLQWPTERHGVILLNEPNHGDEWGGAPDPAAYARFLIDVADALRAADPDVFILNAGLDPYTPHTGSTPFANGQYYRDAESFMDEMVAAYPHVFSHLDGWNSHSYPLGPFTEGPWQQEFQVDWMHDASNPHHIQPPAGIYNRGVNGYEWELFKLATYGLPALPVFITETGWRHAETTEPDAGDNGRVLPSALTVAHYLDLALNGNNHRYPAWPETGWTPWLTDSRVVAVAPFALNGRPEEWGHTNWLQLDSEGRISGVYPALEWWAK
ncbi:MAG: hypothetical protein D8M54_23920 [Chloroflexi bacterium]|nr:hypothetical protein [Chloroflexota bacterium]